MTSRHRFLFSLLALLLTACERGGLLSEDALALYAPTTKRKVGSIEDVPRDVKSVFLGWLNPYRGADFSALPADLRERYAAAAAREWHITDRQQPWSEGCSAGAHFLEAGETKDGWWIFYEAGGIATTYRLVLIKQIDGSLQVTKEHILTR